jgi:hypothetical protein
MNNIYGDFLEGEWNCAFHCANLYKTHGSGIAYFLSNKWPEVYQADYDYYHNFDFPESKLGSFSKAVIPDGRWVYNLYGQVGIGNDGSVLGRNCQYDHLYNAMFLACEDMCKLMGDDDNVILIGIAKNTGCCRAGGSWIVVNGMLQDLEERFPIEFVVYQYGDEKIAQSTQPL